MVNDALPLLGDQEGVVSASTMIRNVIDVASPSVSVAVTVTCAWLGPVVSVSGLPVMRRVVGSNVIPFGRPEAE